MRGIAVGTIELQRLQNIFVQSPSLSWLEFRELLCAILAKDEHQRRVIKHLFEQLVPSSSDDEQQQKTTKKGGDGYKENINSAFKKEESTEAPLKQKPAKQAIDVWKWGEILIILIGLLTALAFFAFNTHEPSDNEVERKSNKTKIHTVKKPNKSPKAEALTINTDLKLVKTLTLWKPEIIGISSKGISSKGTLSKNIIQNSWPSILLLLLSSLGFAWLWQQARLKTRKRQAKPISILKRGTSWLPPLQKQADFHLLDSNERREISWGISHYLSEQPLKQLDIPKSVQASAQEGLPSLHFKSAQHQREVWLWLDNSSDNPDMVKLATEITRTLKAVNIYLQVGYFHALPNKVKSEQGEILWSSRHQHPENHPLVVILMDYSSLNRTGAIDSEQTHQTLQQLSHWQNLCLVDCSLQTGQLCRRLKHFSLDCIQAQDVASWLTKQGTEQSPKVLKCQLDDLHRWALACSLPERPLMEAEIRALHEALELNCHWQYHQLQRYAQHSANGLDFSQSRPQLLTEFSLLARVKENKHFIKKTITFWLERNHEIDTLSDKQETPDKPWKGSNRQYRLKLDSALLQLWLDDQIQQASNTLYDLHQNKQEKYKLKQWIESKLAHYTCQNWDETKNSQNQAAIIVLPHQWHKLKPQTQHQLKAAGLGGMPQDLGLHWNKTSSLILSALLGLMLISIYQSYKAIKPIFMPENAIIKRTSDSAIPKQQQIIQYYDSKTEEMIIGDRKSDGFITIKNVKTNQTLWLSWQKQAAQPAQIKLEKHQNTEIWRLGENATPPLRHKNNQTIAVIANQDNNASKVYQLAAKLLDSGTADQVIISKKDKGWQNYLRDHHVFSADSKFKTHWIFINTNHNDSIKISANQPAAWFKTEIAILLDKLNQNKKFSASELGGKQLSNNIVDKSIVGKNIVGKNNINQNINIALWGLKKEAKEAPNKRVLLEGKSQITLIRIPKGSFQMGSDKGQGNEKPVHQVKIDYDFYMSQNKISFNQYNAYIKAIKAKKGENIKKPDDENWGRENRPVINVSWDDTQGFIQWLNTKTGQHCPTNWHSSVHLASSH